MLTLFQPLLTALVGAALSIFGLFHTIQHLPSPIVWHHVVSASPQLMALVVFAVCVMIAVAGLVMIWSGLRGVRYRLWQLRRVRWQATPNMPTTYDDDPWR